MTQKTKFEAEETDWRPVFEAALRVGKFSSLDELIYRGLNAWLMQLAPELRWQIAIELYKNDQISTGRAAQIAGLNYIVFMEKLRESPLWWLSQPRVMKRKRRDAPLCRL